MCGQSLSPRTRVPQKWKGYLFLAGHYSVLKAPLILRFAQRDLMPPRSPRERNCFHPSRPFTVYTTRCIFRVYRPYGLQIYPDLQLLSDQSHACYISFIFVIRPKLCPRATAPGFCTMHRCIFVRKGLLSLDDRWRLQQ